MSDNESDYEIYEEEIQEPKQHEEQPKEETKPPKAESKPDGNVKLQIHEDNDKPQTAKDRIKKVKRKRTEAQIRAFEKMQKVRQEKLAERRKMKTEQKKQHKTNRKKQEVMETLGIDDEVLEYIKQKKEKIRRKKQQPKQELPPARAQPKRQDLPPAPTPTPQYEYPSIVGN